MNEKPSDLYDGELADDADLDATGTDTDADTGEGYVDPIEADVESVSAPKPTTGPTTLP